MQAPKPTDNKGLEPNPNCQTFLITLRPKIQAELLHTKYDPLTYNRLEQKHPTPPPKWQSGLFIPEQVTKSVRRAIQNAVVTSMYFNIKYLVENTRNEVNCGRSLS